MEWQRSGSQKTWHQKRVNVDFMMYIGYIDKDTHQVCSFVLYILFVLYVFLLKELPLFRYKIEKTITKLVGNIKIMLREK